MWGYVGVSGLSVIHRTCIRSAGCPDGDAPAVLRWGGMHVSSSAGATAPRTLLDILSPFRGIRYVWPTKLRYFCVLGACKSCVLRGVVDLIFRMENSIPSLICSDEAPFGALPMTSPSPLAAMPSFVPSKHQLATPSSAAHVWAILPLVGHAPHAPNTGHPGGTPVQGVVPGSLHVLPGTNGAWVLYKDSRLKESCEQGLYWQNLTINQWVPYNALSNQFAPASVAACSTKPAQVCTPATLQAVMNFIHMTFSLPWFMTSPKRILATW